MVVAFVDKLKRNGNKNRKISQFVCTAVPNT